MRAALAILVLLAGLVPAGAQSAAAVDREIAAMAQANRLYDARLMAQAHRRTMAAWYGWQAPVNAHPRPQRSGGCRYSPQQRTCWSHIQYR